MVKAGVEGVLVVEPLTRPRPSIGDEQLVRRASERPTRPWRHRLVDRDAVPGEGILDLGAGEIMLTRVVPVSPDVSLATALRLFDEYAVNVLPVLDSGRLVGTLFRCDLVKELFHRVSGAVEADT